MRNCVYNLMCVILMALPTFAHANEVALSSKSGDLQISGTVLDFDGRYYSIESEYGNVILDGSLFECSGSGCSGSFRKSETLKIASLASLNSILMPALIENFARLSAGTTEVDDIEVGVAFTIMRGDRQLRIELIETSENGAVESLIAHQIDLALISRDLTEAEKQQHLKSASGSIWPAPRSEIIALDAYVAVSSPLYEKNTLKLSDLQSVDHVSLYTPQNTKVFGSIRVDGAILHDDFDDVLQALDQQKNSIGILPFSKIRDTKMLRLDAPCGTMPPITHRSIKSRDYIWTTPFFLHASSLQRGPQAEEFVNYLSSISAQRVIQRAGFVDLSPEVIPLSAQGQRLAFAVQNGDSAQLGELQQTVRILNGASRLTTTLVFDDGLKNLATRAQSELSHLNRFLGQDRNGFQEVLVVSFAEKSQKEQMSELLKLVSREIGKGLTNSFGSIKSIETHNFANVLPLHCSDAISNAPRIEIWVR